MTRVPRLDRMVYDVAGSMLLWLGRRAWDRGDIEFFDAMRHALGAGHVAGILSKVHVDVIDVTETDAFVHHAIASHSMTEGTWQNITSSRAYHDYLHIHKPLEQDHQHRPQT